MKISIMLPTLDRIEKLSNCLTSLQKAIQYNKVDEISLSLYFYRKVEYVHSEIFNKHIQSCNSDAILYASDDIEFYDDSIFNLARCLEKNYPDLDGLVGMNQINIDSNIAVKWAFGLIGKKFTERFPNKLVFCPDYRTYYTDWEIGAYANKINKFTYCEEAKIFHYHPVVSHLNIDETYKLGQTRRALDAKIFHERRKNNWLWGEDFNTIRNKGEYL